MEMKKTIEERIDEITSKVVDNMDIVKARGLDGLIDYSKFKLIKPWFINRLLINHRNLKDIETTLFSYNNFCHKNYKVGTYNPMHDEVRMVLTQLKYHMISKDMGVELSPFIVKDVVYDYTTHDIKPERMKELADIIINADDETALVYLKDLSNKGGVDSSFQFANCTRAERIMIFKMLEFKRINDFEFGTAYKEYCKIIDEEKRRAKNGRR